MLYYSASAAPHRVSVFAPIPVVIAAYALSALLVAPAAFRHLLVVYGDMMVILLSAIAIGVPAAALILRPRAPMSMVAEIVRRGTLRLAVAIVCFASGLAAFTTLKLQIPRVVPFYADPLLADIDAWLHGPDLGLRLHALVPQWAENALGFAYGNLWFGGWFGLLAYATLQSNRELRARYYWTMLMTIVVVGTVLATAFSSVGPIFASPILGIDRFVDLMSSVYASGAGEHTKGAADYLLDAFRSNDLLVGTGISAMPSVHVAIAVLNAWMLTTIDRRLGIIGWAYAALIQFGSVYLGWHYAIDGYVSALVVSILWWAVGRGLDRVGSPGFRSSRELGVSPERFRARRMSTSLATTDN